MTDREKAEKLVREHAPDHLGPVLEAAIEQALTTAREQGRREEREECAKEADDFAKGIIGHQGGYPLSGKPAGLVQAAGMLAKRIRARSGREEKKAELRKVMDEISEDIARSGRGEG